MIVRNEDNMYCLETKASFDAAHFLYGYEGKCRNIHGHRWQIVIQIGQEELETQGQCKGMIVDFGQLKKDVKAIAQEFDHVLIIEKGTLKPATYAALQDEDFSMVEVDFRPTAENFAKYFYDRVRKQGYQVLCATVYETPNNCASYRE